MLCISFFFSFVNFLKRQRRKIAKKQSIVIPDFIGKPELTLDDILNDPTIPRLPWKSVFIDTVIGKGASGIVSKGTYKT